jgi:hypothetical protein
MVSGVAERRGTPLAKVSQCTYQYLQVIKRMSEAVNMQVRILHREQTLKLKK